MADRKKADDTADDEMAEAREAFEECAEAEKHNRDAALDDLKFARLAEQWPETVRRDRELDGRPCLTINRLPAIIRQVVNDARQNKPAIVVHPVDDASDPDTAEIFNGLIRNIEASSDSEVAYDTALDFAVTGGFGYFRINTAYSSDDTFDQDLVIERVANPFSIYGDPTSTAADSSDWDVAFVVNQLKKGAFETKYKGADAVDWSGAGDYARLSADWCDGDMVTIAEHWRREVIERKIVLLDADPTDDPELLAGRAIAQSEFGLETPIIDLAVFSKNKALFDALGVKVKGPPRTVRSHKVTQKIMSGAEVLETVEWAGKYIPIVPVYGDEMFIDGKRRLRGLVRDAKDPQRMFNYWRTMATELVALAPKTPFIGAKGAFETDAHKWATANTQAHAFLEYDAVGGQPPPQRQPFASVPAGAIQEALNAADDIKSITGLHDASLGARSNETSGVAINARQREGDVSTFHYIDNLSRAIRHAGRILIDLIPKVYSVPRIVRIMGPDSKPDMVRVNQPTTVPVKGPDGQPQTDPQTGELKEIEKIYDLTVGKYDLVVKSGPSFSTKREQFVAMATELMRAVPQLAVVLAEPIVNNFDIPDADSIIAKMQAMMPQPGAANPQAEQIKAQAQQVIGQLQGHAQQVGQQAQQLAAQLQEAQQALEQAKTANDLKAQELEIKGFEAQTKRIEAENRARQPAHLPGQAYEASNF